MAYSRYYLGPLCKIALNLTLGTESVILMPISKMYLKTRIDLIPLFLLKQFNSSIYGKCE